MEKSTRHSKVIGNFGEMLICNWLSRSGFEVCVVDHTGIDLIAYHKKTGLRMGITVKSRARARTGSEGESVNIFRCGNGSRASDRDKLVAACKAFSCEPWIGIYVEHQTGADMFLISLEHFDLRYKGKGIAIEDWKMSPRHLQLYMDDRSISHVHIDFCTTHWQWELGNMPCGDTQVAGEVGQ